MRNSGFIVRSIGLLCCQLFIGTWSSLAMAADIEGVRLWRAPDHTRLVFDLSAPLEHKLFTLENPARVVIDIKNAKFLASLSNLDFKETPIKTMRKSVRDGSNVRVVLDLSHAVNPSSFFLKRQSGIRDRLVIDLYDTNAQAPKPRQPVVPTQTVQMSNAKRNIIIAVDAGHGGEDPGALGPKGIREKNVVLSIAKALVREINSRKGYKAKLIRSGDYYIAKHKRRDMARQMRADLFISIHADAFTKSSARGASVFALSLRGATSEMARFLAAQENKSDVIGGVGNISLNDKDKMLASVLVDLSMTATLDASLQVGSYVLTSMGKVAHLHKKQVEQAGFAVLKSPDVPSILVETGFISNPGEARKLSSKSYQRKLATQVFLGVDKYFRRFPPEGSLIAWEKVHGNKATVYTIARGDTLSGIAKRFNVSLKGLRQANKLKNSMIKVGQKIKIPAA